MKLIARERELAWLDEQRGQGLVLLTGLPGAGKRSLLKEWLRLSRAAHSWYTFDSFQSLPRVLGFQGALPEKALEKAHAQIWSGQKVVVWSWPERLVREMQHLLLSFLFAKRSPETLHVLISDEDLSVEGRWDIPVLRLGGLSLEGIKEFLAEHSHRKDDPESLLEKTAGLPLLLNLWESLRAPQDFGLALLRSLSPREREILSLLAAWARPLGEDDLEALGFNNVARPLLRLRRLHLLEASGEERRFTLSKLLRQLVRSQETKAERLLSDRRCLDLLNRRRPSEDELEALRGLHFALRATSETDSKETLGALTRYLRRADPAQLELLASEDLKDFSEALEGAGLSLQEEERALCDLFRLRAQLLRGERQRALEWIDGWARGFPLRQTTPLSEAEQDLGLEAVQQLNRAGRRQAAQRLARALEGLFGEERRWSLKVEVAVTLIEQAPAEAAALLEKVLEALAQEKTAKLVWAHAEFQMARLRDLQGRFSEARRHYEQARSIFIAQRRFYLAAVTELNLCWLALKANDLASVSDLLILARERAQRYGYDYVRAGLDLIEAQRLRCDLRPQSALNLLESSARLLGGGAPPRARLDMLAEKLRCLLLLGRYQEAQALLGQLRAEARGDAVDYARRLLEELELETQLYLGELRPGAYESDFDSSFLRQRRLRLGIEVSPRALPSLDEKAARLEQKLMKALAEERDCEPFMTELGALPLTELPAEACALELVRQSQKLFAQGRSPDPLLLQRIEERLSTWPADEAVKAPLRAWLESLRQGPQNRGPASPESHPLWRNAHPLEAARWRAWCAPLWRQARGEGPLLWITPAGKQSLHQPPAEHWRAVDLALDEELALLFWKGREIPAFHRRHCLRRLAAALIWRAPEGLNKEELCRSVWKESYRPSVHDARIYTSVQRLRSLLGGADLIHTSPHGYALRPGLSYSLLTRSEPRSAEGNARTQNLILRALQGLEGEGLAWVSRSHLVEATGVAPASLKRELARLVSAQQLKRRGAGRAVVYARP